ncbi:hypothetical protein [Nocardioides panzhihuensis]|uniref:Uncharacterized protein n=1 Tax=Nocardioides panzhihuensis TaxID=860243 RepID=A0A7Z0DMC9_9ACTN|nr:hypothetical protein [Nocardioides panzhihuensis]NYI78043.1 hypothetical protein [Nocardioides panzhihuensis]
MSSYASLSDGTLAVGRDLIERELLNGSGADAVKLQWAFDQVVGDTGRRRAVAQVGREDARVAQPRRRSRRQMGIGSAVAFRACYI